MKGIMSDHSKLFEISIFFFSFYHFYIYLHVITLFVPITPPPTPLPLQFCWRENIRDNKKDIDFASLG
jgi:hypothetical protein